MAAGTDFPADDMGAHYSICMYRYTSPAPYAPPSRKDTTLLRLWFVCIVGDKKVGWSVGACWLFASNSSGEWASGLSNLVIQSDMPFKARVGKEYSIYNKITV